MSEGVRAEQILRMDLFRLFLSKMFSSTWLPEFRHISPKSTKYVKVHIKNVDARIFNISALARSRKRFPPESFCVHEVVSLPSAKHMWNDSSRDEYVKTPLRCASEGVLRTTMPFSSWDIWYWNKICRLTALGTCFQNIIFKTHKNFYEDRKFYDFYSFLVFPFSSHITNSYMF